MPRGKKKLKTPVMPPQEDIIVVPVPTEEQEREMEKLVDELAESKLCNHRNMHTRKQTLCILPKGHDGNHSDGKYDWSDAAGYPNAKEKISGHQGDH